MTKKGFLKNDNEIMLPITRGELVLDSSGQQAFHSGQFLANEDRHGLMSNEDKINIKNIIEKTNDLDTNALNSAINSIKNAYLKSVNVNNTIVTITDQLDHETNFYNTIYTFESGTDGSFTVKENGGNSQTITVGGTLTDEKVGQKNTTDNKEYRILLSNSNNDNNEVAPSNKSGKLLFNPSTGILTAKSFIGERFEGKIHWNNIDNKPETFTPETHNHSTNQIFISNEYIKFENSESISSTDPLTKALGKLEYKADLGKTAYDIVFAANNNNTIENLTEILKVLEGIKDTDTIQAIVNKYLPLSGGTMSGNINFGSDKGIYVNNSYAILALGSKGKFTGHPNDEESYTFVGTTNYNTIIRTKNKLQVYKNSNRYNIIDSSGGTISGSLTWEIPDYSVIPIIRNIKFTETTGWARKILAMQVDGVEQFSLGAYGSYNFPLNSENPNKADYLYLGFGGYNGNSLRVYPNGIKFGNETIWHSGNCNFLSSTNKNLTPAGSEITNAKIGELIGYQAINKSTWVYANNGYIKTEWGNMELAGSSILSFGTSSAYTQLFISAPSSSRGDGLINEMMFYNNHGSTYSPGWTRVVTNRNYTKIFGNPFKVNDQSYNIASDGSVSTGDIYLEMWRGDKASWKLINTDGTFKFQCNYTDKVVDYYDALTIGYNTGNIHTKGKIQINLTSAYTDEKTLPDHAKLIIGNVTDGGTYGLYFSRSSIQHMTNNKAVNNPLLINPLGGLVKIGDGGLESSSFIKANAFVLNGKDEDRNLIRINNTDGDINKKSYYGFTLKYLGSGAGDNNSLALFSDNQTNTSQNKSFEIKQSGNIHTRSILPLMTDNTLGTSTNRWNYVYANYGNFTGNINIINSSGGETPHLIFQRGTTSDGTYDWHQFANSGELYFGYNYNNTYYQIVTFGGNSIKAPRFISTIETGTQPYSCTSTTCNTNLNADLLDGTHKADLFTAISSSSTTNLSITVGGTTKSVTDLYSTYLSNAYSSRPTTLSPGITGSGTMIQFKNTSSCTDSDKPGDGHVLHFNWDNAGGWDSQILLTTGGTLYTRGMETAKTWGSWKTILNSSNFESFISNKYLPLSGGTMIGSIITPANDSEGIWPATNNYGQIGSSSKKFYRMYASTFYGNLNGNVAGSYIELSAATPYIDFHYNSSTADYTSRIIEYADYLHIIGKPVRNSSLYTYVALSSSYNSSDAPTFVIDCNSVKDYTFLTMDITLYSNYTGTYGHDIIVQLKNLYISASYILRLNVKLYNASKTYWNSSQATKVTICNDKGSSDKLTYTIPITRTFSSKIMSIGSGCYWMIPTNSGLAILATLS